jgi:hypothetical protein
VGFKPTTSVFERSKMAHALDIAATVIGRYLTIGLLFAHWQNINSFWRERNTRPFNENTRWFKYDRHWFVCKQAAISPGHIWTTLYLPTFLLESLSDQIHDTAYVGSERQVYSIYGTQRAPGSVWMCWEKRKPWQLPMLNSGRERIISVAVNLFVLSLSWKNKSRLMR